VLVDGPNTIAGALDVLRYLAAGRVEGNWLGGAGQAGKLMSWLQLSERLGATLGMARLAMNFGVDADIPALHAEGRTLLRQIDEHLWFAERESAGWLLAGEAPTLADIACFPDLALCEEGGLSRQDYPALRRWLDRVKRLDGFVTMSGVFPTAAEK
jgi:glutathione S-transferase